GMGVVFVEVSRRATARVEESSARAHQAALDGVVSRINRYLANGDQVLVRLEKEFTAGSCPGVTGAESCMMTALLSEADISEVTFITEHDGIWQLSVFRRSDGRI